MNFCCNHFNYLVSEIFTHFPNNVDGELIYCCCVVGILRLVAIESGRAREIVIFKEFLELWSAEVTLEILNLMKKRDLNGNFAKFWFNWWAMHTDLQWRSSTIIFSLHKPILHSFRISVEKICVSGWFLCSKNAKISTFVPKGGKSVSLSL